MEEGKYLIWEGGTVIDGHTNKVSGTVWNIYIELDPKTGEESIVAEINIFRGKDNYNKLWNAIRRGNLQWSMGVRVDKARKECDKRGCYLRVFPEHWYELSAVYRGCGPTYGNHMCFKWWCELRRRTRQTRCVEGRYGCVDRFQRK